MTVADTQTLPDQEGPEYTPCSCSHIEPEHEPNAGACWSCDCEAYRPAAAAVPAPAPTDQAAERHRHTDSTGVDWDHPGPLRTCPLPECATAPADRAAIEAAALREAAEDYATLTDQNEAYDREEGDLDEAARLQYGTVRDIVIGLRRKANEIEAATSGPGGAAGETQQDETQAACPHCPDGHTPPTGSSQPWSAWVASERDGDGQPMQITVARSAGAHVAESDAQWIRSVLNGRAVAPTSDLPLDHPLRRECRCSEAGVCRRCLERASASGQPAAVSQPGKEA